MSALGDFVTAVEGLGPLYGEVKQAVPAVTAVVKAVSPYVSAVAPLVQKLPVSAFKDPATMTPTDIGAIGAFVHEAVTVASTFYPPLALFAPGITTGIVSGLGKVVADVKSGAIVKDGAGGYIPAHGQSEYNPMTGEFTGKKT